MPIRRCPVLATATLALLAHGAARGDEAETIRVSGGHIAPAPPLDAVQPTTTLGTAFIRDVAPPTAAYDELVRLTPSVVSVAPNGPGLAENAVLTIRGFSDGQYNVTFDGIPFGDTDDFTHHSTAYFAPQALGAVSVDRGPGTGATVGNATFGGTVSLRSVDTAADPGAALSGTVGSFNTRRAGLRLDSGRIAALHDASLVVDAEQLDSDGALTRSGSRRANLFAKTVLPLGTATLTVAGAIEWLQQNQPPGATRAQISASGPDFALGADPAAQNFSGFNGEHYRTDFSYAALQAPVGGGVTLDDRIYTYALDRHFESGADPNGDTPNGTALFPDDVPGRRGEIGLRAWGAVLRAERRWNPVTLRLGLWGEYQANSRGRYEVDLSRGGSLNPVLLPVPGVPDSAATDRQQADALQTLQPYGELEWRPLPGLAVLPGLRWSYSARQVSASVMEGTRLPTAEHAEFSTLLPSVAIRQRLSAGWSAYLQAAKGDLAPSLQLLDTTRSPNDVSPERSWNLQLGSTWQSGGWSLSADAYLIAFDNLNGTRTVGGETVAFSQGGATYAGLEAEATVPLGHGVSLYGNGSLNRARDHDTGAPLPNAADATLAGGLLWRVPGWFAAVTDKWVGARYGDTGRQAGLDPFNQLDLSAGHSLPLPGRLPALRMQLQVQNLLDSRKIDALAGYTAAGNTPLWFTQAGRSLWMTASVGF